MGLIRKTMSISTLGIIDLRSDKERIARSTRKTKKAVVQQTKAAKRDARAARQQTAAHSQLIKEQNSLQREQTALQAAMVTPALSPAGPPPGWYPDPAGQPFRRWWDGVKWTEHADMPTPGVG